MNWFFPFKSLRTGLLITYLVLIATSLGLLAWRIGSSLDASRLAETQRDQEGRSILAASTAGEWLADYREGRISAATLVDNVATLSREIQQAVVVLDANGIVLVDSDQPNEVGHDESQQPEVMTAMTGRPKSFMRYDPDDNGDALFAAAPVQYQRQVVGIVRLELPMNLVHEASQQFWLRIAGATTLAGVATILVSLFFARALTQPLAQLTRAARLMASGDLKPRVRVSGPDELVQLANSFNFMAGRVSRVMEDQRAFVANAAHELRTPLTTIRLRAEALREGAKDDPAVATQFLSEIESETDRLSRLVDDLLNLSRIETGLVEPRREPVSVPQVASVVAEKLLPRASELGVSLHVETDGNLPAVQADPNQIQQVLINLIGNAFKFTPSGGTVKVRSHVAKREDGAGHWIVTTVRDSGTGIPADDLAHIFERFYRGDKARSRETGGTGLGLAIVKSIVEGHRGRVWAESEWGKGTSISFALPVARNKSD